MGAFSPASVAAEVVDMIVATARGPRGKLQKQALDPVILPQVLNSESCCALISFIDSHFAALVSAGPHEPSLFDFRLELTPSQLAHVLGDSTTDCVIASCN